MIAELPAMFDDMAPTYYHTGGTMPPGAPSYIVRQADTDLYEFLSRGEYCYVLTPRQMGKSSIMVRTAARLRDDFDTSVCIIDLTAIGHNLTPDQWYLGMLRRVGRQLRIEDELDDYWEQHRSIGPLQRWIAALNDVVLVRCRGKLVVFVDEIDFVRNLSFPASIADELFAGIRECFNRRSTEPNLRRLTFCLLGVAAPTNLIKDPRTTPFNIGRRVDLLDFTESESASLVAGLATGSRNGAQLLRRVLYWTQGQPFLTQRLCDQIALRPEARTSADVDQVCHELLLSRLNRDLDDHLLYISRWFSDDTPEAAERLGLYKQVLSGKRIAYDQYDGVIAALLMSGIVRVERGFLRVRNPIYAHVFDQGWIQSAMPGAEVRRQRAAYVLGVRRTLTIASIVGVMLVTLSVIAILASIRARQAEASAREQLFVADMNIAQRAVEENNFARALQLLENHHREPESSRFEWQYLWRQCHEAVYSMRDAGGAVGSVRFSRDGKSLLEMNSVTLAVDRWDYATGALSHIVPGIPQSRIQLWYPRTGILSPDGVRAVQCEVNGCTIFDSGTGNRIASVRSDNIQTTAESFSDDGKYLVTGDGLGYAHIWDAATGRPFKSIFVGGNSIATVKLSPDNRKLVVARYDGPAFVWDVASGRQLYPISDGHKAIFAVCFSSDGGLVAMGGRDGLIRVWDASDGHLVQTVPGHSGRITSIEFNRAEHNFLSASKDQTVRVWDAQSDTAQNIICGATGAIDSVAVSPDGNTVASGSSDGAISVWNLRGQNALSAPSLARKPLHWISVLPPDGARCLAVDSGNRLWMWDTASGRVCWNSSAGTVSPQSIPVNLAVSKDGTRLFTAGWDGKGIIRDSMSGKIVHVITEDLGFVPAEAFSPDGHLLALANNKGEIEVWNTDTCGHLSRFTVPFPTVSVLAFSKDNSIVVVGDLKGKHLVQVDARTGRIHHNLDGGEDPINDLELSPDGKIMAAAGSNGVIHMWPMNSSGQPHPGMLLGNKGVIYTVAFSPDGRTMATGGDGGTIHVWDRATSEEVLTLPGRDGHSGVATLQFDATGKYLFSADDQGDVRRW